MERFLNGVSLKNAVSEIGFGFCFSVACFLALYLLIAISFLIAILSILCFFFKYTVEFLILLILDFKSASYSFCELQVGFWLILIYKLFLVSLKWFKSNHWTS